MWLTQAGCDEKTRSIAKEGYGGIIHTVHLGDNVSTNATDHQRDKVLWKMWQLSNVDVIATAR